MKIDATLYFVRCCSYAASGAGQAGERSTAKPQAPVIVYTGTRVNQGGGGSFNSSQIPEIYMENVKSVNQP